MVIKFFFSLSTAVHRIIVTKTDMVYPDLELKIVVSIWVKNVRRSTHAQI